MLSKIFTIIIMVIDAAAGWKRNHLEMQYILKKTNISLHNTNTILNLATSDD